MGNKKTLFLCLSLYLIVNSALFYYFENTKESRENLYFRQKIEKFQSELQATKNSFHNLSNFIASEINQNQEILRLISLSSSSRHQQKKLNEKLKTFYSLLKNYKLYNFSILTISKETILNPQKNYVFKKPFSSNKLFHTTLQYCYPLFYNKKLIANLKFFISFKDIQEELEKLFPNSYDFIIYKKYLLNLSLKEGKRVFVQSLIDKEFFEEKKVSEKTKSSLPINKINLFLSNKIKNSLLKFSPFATHVMLADKCYIISFLPISPIEGGSKKIGYLISYERDNNFPLIKQNFIKNMILSMLITLILLIGILYFLNLANKLKQKAITDKLTGLLNRTVFYEILKKEINKSLRYNRNLSLAMIDIDYFKSINDTYGHDIGDMVLKELSKIIKENIRQSDYAFRWGGEEFIVAMPETSIEGAEKLAEKLRIAVKEHKFYKVNFVTISVGVAEFFKNETIDELIKRADEALYASKEGGRNLVTVSSKN
jgi:diguanylate cyclase (GGDEF)-like protein